MPSSSSRLNIKYLENSDEKDSSSDSHSSPTRATSHTDKAKTQTHHHQKEKVDSNELSNDASNETSDSDNNPSDPQQFEAAAQLGQTVEPPADSSNMTNDGLSSLQPQPASSSVPQAPPSSGQDVGGTSEAGTIESTSHLSDKLSRTGLQKAFFCKICNQGFTRKHNMVSHELIHTSLKVHRCEICDISFRRIHDLKRHEKLHTGEKPFQCNRCHRHFARTDALSRHLNSPNACTGNILRDQANASTPSKLGLETNTSSNKSETPISLVANMLSTETSVSAIMGRSEKDNGPTSMLPLAITSSNSSSLGLPAANQNNSTSDSTAQSSNLMTPTKKILPSAAANMNIQQSNDNKTAFPSSSLSSGSIELSQYELNKWRPLQYHEAANEEAENQSADSQNDRSEVSSRVASSESSGGHIPLRTSTGSRSGEFPKTTTTTTTTTTMEQGNGPMSQNYLQQMSLKRDEGNNRQYQNDHHYYHHIHYYHHVHNYEGQQPGFRGQYISQGQGQGQNPNKINNLRGESGPDRFNDRPLALRHQRVLSSDGYGQQMGANSQQSLNYNRPVTFRNNSDQGRGERIVRSIPFERGDHPGGGSQYLPVSPSYERQWEPNDRANRQIEPESEGNYRGQRQEHQALPAFPQQEGPLLHQRLQLHNHEEIQRHNLGNANGGSQDQSHPTQVQQYSGPTGQQRTNGKRSFVSMEKYENLMNYASNLQNSLTTLESRLVALESEKQGQNHSDDKRPRMRDENEAN